MSSIFNKFLTLAIALLVIAAAATPESAAPEQEFEVASPVWGSADFVELQATTPRLLDNVITLKAYCMAARKKVQLNKGMKLDKNAFLSKFVIAFGKKPDVPKGPKYDLHKMAFVARNHKAKNVIADYAKTMGTLKSQYTKGLGHYLWQNIDRGLASRRGVIVYDGALMMFSHKALGFTYLPKYVVAMAAPVSAVNKFRVMLTKINRFARVDASRRALEKREKANAAKAKRLARKKAAAKTVQARLHAASERKSKAAKATAKEVHESNHKAAVKELLKKAEARRVLKAKHMEQKRKLARIRRAKDTSASFKCTSRIKSTNNAGVVRVGTKGGYAMTGGGMINNYRSWNKHAGFEEMMPEGNHFRCDMGFGLGRLHCYSIGCQMKGGLTCKTWSKRLTRSGVQRVAVGHGYTMTGGGIYNHYRHFNARSGFEESFPEGNHWRGDMGFGWGDFTVYARGCKAPAGHKLQCITARGKSNANYAHATCPSGYQLTGCGINNHYRHFNKLSGFEATHPNGNKCSCDSGFGHGKNTCYARCCRSVSQSVHHLMKKEKAEKKSLQRHRARENSEKHRARAAEKRRKALAIAENKSKAARKAASARRAAAHKAARKRAAARRAAAARKRAAARRAAARRADLKRAKRLVERRQKHIVKRMKERMKKRLAAQKKKMDAKIRKLKDQAKKEKITKARMAAAKKRHANALENKTKAAHRAAQLKAKRAAEAKHAAKRKLKLAKSEKAKKAAHAKVKVAAAKERVAKKVAKMARARQARANRHKAAMARKEHATKAKARAALRKAKSASPVVYQHCNFGGYRKVLHHSTSWVHNMGVKNDDLSSIKVPAGKCVVLYQHAHYKGKAWKICGKTEVKCFVHHKMLGGKSWNDQVSSIKVISSVKKAPAAKLKKVPTAAKLKRVKEDTIVAKKKAIVAKKKAHAASKKVRKEKKKLSLDRKKMNRAPTPKKVAKAAKKVKEAKHKVRAAKAKRAAAKRKQLQKARIAWSMRRAHMLCARAKAAALKLKVHKSATYGSGAVAEATLVQVMHHRATNHTKTSKRPSKIDRRKLAAVLRLKRACTKALHAHAYAVAKSRREAEEVFGDF